MTDAPPTAEPTIDLDAAGKLLRRVEAHHDVTGWHRDGNMWVYAVYDHHDVVTGDAIGRAMCSMGDPVRNSRYTAQPMLSPRKFAEARNPGDMGHADGLYRFAMNVAYADTDQMGELGRLLEVFRVMLRMPGILGFIACHEAWQAANLPLGPDQHVWDLPGAEECRLAVMADVCNRIHLVSRARGRTSELAADVGLRGAVATSLRLLMDTCQDRVPADQASYDLRYPGARDRPPPG